MLKPIRKTGTRWAGVVLGLLLPVLASLGAFAQTHVVMWLSSQPVAVNAWAEEFERLFNQENRDLRLELQVHPSVTEQRERLILTIAAGTAPDVVYEASNVMGTWVMNGIAAPLDPYLERMRDADDFIPGIIDGVRYGGRTYAMPFSVWVNADLYNLDMVNAAGLTLPSTWDELIAAVRVLTRYRDDGSPEVLGYRTTRSGIFAYIDLQRAMEQLGTTTIDPLGNRATIRSEQAQRAMEVLRELYRLGMAGTPGGTAVNDVALGRVAIQHLAQTLNSGALYDQTVQLNVPVEFRAIVGPDAESGIVHHNAGTLFIVNASDKKDAAWRVVEAWVSPDNMTRYLLAHAGSLPARISLLARPELQELPFADQAFALLAGRVTTYGAKHPLFADFRAAAGEYLQRAIEGEMGIPTALEQAEAAVNQVVRDFRL